MIKPDICLINDSFPPVIDGVANVVHNYASILNKHGYMATVATPKYPGTADDYPFDVVRFPSIDTVKISGYRTGLPFDRRTLRILTDKNPDIIHTHCPMTSILLSRLLRETTGAPIILTYHTKYDEDAADLLPAPLQSPLLKAIAENASACDEIWTVSRGAGENLKSLGYEGDYIIMPNGVDFPKGRADIRSINAVRARYSLYEDIPVLLYVGRLKWYKGIRIILDGLRLLKDKGLPFRMLLVGDGADRADMEQYTAELGLSDAVIFAGSVSDREDLRAYFSAADLFLFPSTFDTNGIVVREAAACGLASLLIKDSCAAEGIIHGHTGLLIDENAEALASEVEKVLLNRAFAREVGSTAQNEIYLSWEDAVRKAEERYVIVMEKFRGRKHIPRTSGDKYFATLGQLFEKSTRLWRTWRTFRKKLHGK